MSDSEAIPVPPKLSQADERNNPQERDQITGFEAEFDPMRFIPSESTMKTEYPRDSTGGPKLDEGRITEITILLTEPPEELRTALQGYPVGEYEFKFWKKIKPADRLVETHELHAAVTDAKTHRVTALLEVGQEIDEDGYTYNEKTAFYYEPNTPFPVREVTTRNDHEGLIDEWQLNRFFKSDGEPCVQQDEWEGKPGGGQTTGEAWLNKRTFYRRGSKMEFLYSEIGAQGLMRWGIKDSPNRMKTRTYLFNTDEQGNREVYDSNEVNVPPHQHTIEQILPPEKVAEYTRNP